MENHLVEINLLRRVQAMVYLIGSNAAFPNNNALPLIFYTRVLRLQEGDAETLEYLFKNNGWNGGHRNGISEKHHYHSHAHEAMGVYQGRAKVQFGGPWGLIKEVRPGDVVIIPSGVAHKNLESTQDFACVSTYPTGQSFDLNYESPKHRIYLEEKIKATPLPSNDPVFGKEGELLRYWKKT